MEALSCAESCPGVFATVKEVYFFGCNTLNPHPLTTAPASVLRSLVREGHSQQQAQNQLEQLNSRLGDSMRERMRRVAVLAHGFVGLPGSLASASSLYATWVEAGGGEGRKPVVLYNRNNAFEIMRGYAADVLSHSIKGHDRIIQFADSIEDLWNRIARMVPELRG